MSEKHVLVEPTNALVILGAGASYGVVADNPHPARFKEKNHRPLLTAKLFSDEGLAGELLPSYPLVRQLAADLLFETRNRSLESVLQEFKDSAQPDVQGRLLQLPLYLRDMFWQASQDYVTEPVNYTALVSELMRKFSKVAPLTLNYDLMIDTALTQSGHWGPTGLYHGRLPARPLASREAAWICRLGPPRRDEWRCPSSEESTEIP